MIIFSNNKIVFFITFVQYWSHIPFLFDPGFTGYTHFSFFYLDINRVTTRFPINPEVHNVSFTGDLHRNTWILTVCILGFEFTFEIAIVDTYSNEEDELPANYQ